MALLEGAMDLSLDAFRELKAAPDQWMGSEAAHTMQFAANVVPCSSPRLRGQRWRSVRETAIAGLVTSVSSYRSNVYSRQKSNDQKKALVRAPETP